MVAALIALGVFVSLFTSVPAGRARVTFQRLQVDKSETRKCIINGPKGMQVTFPVTKCRKDCNLMAKEPGSNVDLVTRHFSDLFTTELVGKSCVCSAKGREYVQFRAAGTLAKSCEEHSDAAKLECWRMYTKFSAQVVTVDASGIRASPDRNLMGMGQFAVQPDCDVCEGDECNQSVLPSVLDNIGEESRSIVLLGLKSPDLSLSGLKDFLAALPTGEAEALVATSQSHQGASSVADSEDAADIEASSSDEDELASDDLNPSSPYREARDGDEPLQQPSAKSAGSYHYNPFSPKWRGAEDEDRPLQQPSAKSAGSYHYNPFSPKYREVNDEDRPFKQPSAMSTGSYHYNPFSPGYREGENEALEQPFVPLPEGDRESETATNEDSSAKVASDGASTEARPSGSSGSDSEALPSGGDAGGSEFRKCVINGPKGVHVTFPVTKCVKECNLMAKQPGSDVDLVTRAFSGLFKTELKDKSCVCSANNRQYVQFRALGPLAKSCKEDLDDAKIECWHAYTKFSAQNIRIEDSGIRATLDRKQFGPGQFEVQAHCDICHGDDCSQSVLPSLLDNLGEEARSTIEQSLKSPELGHSGLKDLMDALPASEVDALKQRAVQASSNQEDVPSAEQGGADSDDEMPTDSVHLPASPATENQADGQPIETSSPAAAEGSRESEDTKPLNMADMEALLANEDEEPDAADDGGELIQELAAESESDASDAGSETSDIEMPSTYDVTESDLEPLDLVHLDESPASEAAAAEEPNVPSPSTHEDGASAAADSDKRSDDSAASEARDDLTALPVRKAGVKVGAVAGEDDQGKAASSHKPKQNIDEDPKSAACLSRPAGFMVHGLIFLSFSSSKYLWRF